MVLAVLDAYRPTDQFYWKYNDVNNRKVATTFSFINLFKSTLHCFGRQIRPFSGALLDRIYSFLYNAPTLLPTGVTVEMEPSSISTVASVGSSVGALYQKLYIQSKIAPEDGRICRPKHLI